MSTCTIFYLTGYCPEHCKCMSAHILAVVQAYIKPDGSIWGCFDQLLLFDVTIAIFLQIVNANVAVKVE